MLEFLNKYKKAIRDSFISYVDEGVINSLLNYLDWNNSNITDLTNRVLTLENNETVYQIFEYLGKSTSGTITIPTEATLFDVYGDGLLDAIMVEADENNNPTEENSLNSVGDIVQVTSLNNSGAYVLTSTPVENSCILFFIKIKDQYKENVATESIIPPAVKLDPDFKILENFAGNGVIEGMTITINPNNTSIDISAGCGYVINNYTDPHQPIVTKVTTIDKTAVAITNIATANATYIAIDRLGAVIQQTTPFTMAQRRDYILLGAAIHSNRTTINVVNNLPDVVLDSHNQMNDLIDSIGNFNVEGNIFSAHGADLNINKSAGKIFKRGVNFSVDSKNPHVKDLPTLVAPSNIRYRLSTGLEYADTNTVSKYYESPLGTRVALGNNEFTIQRISIFSSNLVRIQYGQAIYNSLTSAVQALDTESFIVEQNIAENGLLRGYLILAGRTTSLLDPADCIFIEADKFGKKAASTAGGTASLQQAYNNSVIPQILLSSLLGAFTIKSQTNDGSSHIVTLLDSDGDVVEYTDSSGFHQVRYRDEYPSGTWVDAGAQAAPDIVAHTVGGVNKNYVCFDGSNTEERKSNQFELAHDIAFVVVNSGVLKLEVHGHIRPSTNTAGVARFYFDWSYSPANSNTETVGGAIPQASLPIDFVIGANQQYFQKLAGIELPIPVGGYVLGGLIDFSIRRSPADPVDTYPDDVLFLQFAMHVPIDGGGSRQRYIK